MQIQKKYVLLFFLALSLSFRGQGQTTFTNDGEVQDAEIVIEKERKIKLNNQVKLYEFIKWNPDRREPEAQPNNFKMYSYNLGFEPTQFKPVKVKIEKKGQNYDHYLKAGFGNYVSPLIDLSLNTPGNANQTAGINVKHYSFAKGAVDGKNSGSGTTEDNLFGVLVGEKAKVGGSFNYKLDNNYYYGYPAGSIMNNEDIKHNSNFISAKIDLTDNQLGDKWYYDLGIGYQGYSDNFQAKENTMLYDLTIGFSDKIFLKTDGALSNYSDTGIGESRSYFRINPYYALTWEGLHVDVGMSVSLQDDSARELSSSRFFPYLNANYELNESYSAFASLDGGYTFNSLYDFALEVPVLSQSVIMSNSEILYDFRAGMMGNPLEQLGLKATIGVQSVIYLPVFVNDNEVSRINIAYAAEPSTIFTFGAEAQYKVNSAHNLSLSANFYSYNSDSYSQIYHRPTTELIMSGDHTLIEKLNLKWQFAYTAGLVGYEVGTDTDVALDAIPKLDIALHYQLKDRLGMFISGKNIVNQNYSRYLYYPERGIVIQGGVTLRL